MRTWLLILGLAMIAESATAQDALPFADVAKAVKALGSDSFVEREKASTFLFAAGRAAEPALEKARQSKDVEVANRARDILAKFHWGIYPDTPKGIIEQIGNFKAAARDQERLAAFKTILSQHAHGPRTAALLVARVEESEEGMPKYAVRQSQNLGYELRMSVLAELPDRLWRKELDALEQLLEFCLVTKRDEARRDYAAFLLLRGRVEMQIPRWRARAELPGGADAAALLTYLYRIASDAKNARWAAEKSNDPSLIEMVLHEQGAWAELVALHPKMTSSRGTPAFKSAYLRLAGQTKEFEDSVAVIVKDTLARPDSDWWQAKAPLFNGVRIPEAIEVLRHGGSQGHHFAYAILCAQTRYREAFRFVDQAPAKEKYSLQIARAETLHGLGEAEQACKILKEHALGWKARLAAANEKETYDAYVDLPAAEYRLRLHEDAIDHAEQLMQRFPKEDGNIVWRIFWADKFDATLWWVLLRHEHSKEPFAKSLDRLHAMRQKRVPLAEVEALVKAGIPWLKSANRQNELWHLADNCRGFGLEDLERLCLEKLAEWDNRPLELCHFLLRKKQWADAEANLAKIKNDTAAYYLRGWALVKMGREKEGRRWMELAHWRPLGDNRERHSLSFRDDYPELWDVSKRDWDLTLRLGPDDDYYVSYALEMAARTAARQGKFVEAIAMAERGDLQMLCSGTGYLHRKSYIREPHRILVMRAQADIDAGKHDAARRTMQSAAELMPGEIDLPLACVPALEHKGRKADADALFDRFFAHCRKLCKDFPRSGEFHNKVAWLAARCHRQLDAALDHAKEAVKLAPKNTTYLDTLAEVHFQRNEQDLALEAITRATALQPESAYLRKQRQRMMAGDRAVPVPEN
jgi:tetratricopeptide (TPR) repeat protein